MNVIDAINSRYSARGYKPDPVSRDILEKIVVAATRAPSASNIQPWQIYVASGEPLERIRTEFKARQESNAPANTDIGRVWPSDMRERQMKHMEERRRNAPPPVAPPVPGSILFGAPVVIYLCCDPLSAFSIFDLGLAAENVMLAAKEYDLDTVPAGNFVLYQDLIRGELGIPDDQLLILGIALGYATEEAAARPRRDRRPIEEVVHFVGI
jgi:nitroreductase